VLELLEDGAAAALELLEDGDVVLDDGGAAAAAALELLEDGDVVLDDGGAAAAAAAALELLEDGDVVLDDGRAAAAVVLDGAVTFVFIPDICSLSMFMLLLMSSALCGIGLVTFPVN
jgi:hypothetical protein